MWELGYRLRVLSHLQGMLQPVNVSKPTTQFIGDRPHPSPHPVTAQLISLVLQLKLSDVEASVPQMMAKVEEESRNALYLPLSSGLTRALFSVGALCRPDFQQILSQVSVFQSMSFIGTFCKPCFH